MHSTIVSAKAKFGFLTVLMILVFGLLPLPVSAATINTTGSCSLYNAIMSANSDTATGGCPAGSGADTIRLRSIDISLVNFPTAAITSDITIDGSGVEIDAGDSTRIFVHTSGDFVLEDITLTRGNAGTSDGGAIVSTGGTLTLDNVQVTNSTADQGGAIAASVPTTIRNSVISGNSATNNAGGIYALSTTLTIENSAIYSNSAASGGGAIIHSVGDLTVTNSTIYGNSSTVGSGGIWSGGTGSPTRRLRHVTITGNTSSGTFGAVTLQLNTQEIAIENSIIYGNTGNDCDNATLTGSVNSIIGSRSKHLHGRDWYLNKRPFTTQRRHRFPALFRVAFK